MPPNKDAPPTGPVQPPPPASGPTQSLSPAGGPAPSPPPASGPEKAGDPDTDPSSAPGKVKAAPTGPADDIAPAAKPLSADIAPQQALVTGNVPVPATDLEHYHTAQGGKFEGAASVNHNLIITIANLRANSKMFLNMRDDQWALWSAGGSLRGVNVTATKDPVLYLGSFLINAREMYLETYADSVEMQINLYVCTPQNHLRGRVDLPPGASVTLATRSDQTSVVGLSSFDIEF